MGESPLHRLRLSAAGRVRRGDNLWRERLQLDRALGRRARPAHQPDPALQVGMEGALPSISFLVATSHQGLLRVSDGRVARVATGCSYYGLAPAGNRWLAFEQLGRWGRIARLDPSMPKPASTALHGLSPGVHQIPTTPDALFVTDTYNNRILVYNDFGADSRSWRRADAIHFPAGPLGAGRRSTNYAHFNSLRRHDDVWHLVAHNESSSTGRRSELFVLDDCFDIKEVRSLPHTCCHNFVRHDSVEFYCGSGEGVLVADGDVVFATSEFTRGLAVNDEFILLGGSPRLERSARGAGEGTVFVLDWGFRVLATLRVPGTQIHDVQLLAGKG